MRIELKKRYYRQKFINSLKSNRDANYIFLRISFLK